MLTPKEFIEERPDEAHLYGLELFEHILQGDTKQTAYKDGSPNRAVFDEFQSEMGKHAAPDGLADAYEDTFRKDYEVVPTKSDGGELILERYIEGDDKPFDEWIKVESYKPAITIVMDAIIPWNEREGSKMKERHDKIYRIVAEAEAEGRPCRVIAVIAFGIPEKRNPLVLYITIKDYKDPIFTGIWGALKTNKASNCLANAIADFLIGTKDAGNGHAETTYLGGEFEDDEVIVIDSSRISREVAPWKK